MQQIQDSSRRNMFKDRFSTFGRQSKRQLATASSIFTVEEKKSKGKENEKENGDSNGKKNGAPND
jgi:hypothetical protein